MDETVLKEASLVVTWNDLCFDLQLHVIEFALQLKDKSTINHLMQACKETRLMCCKMIQTIEVNSPGDNPGHDPGTWTDFLDAISGFPSLAVLKRLVIDCSKIEFLPNGMEWNELTYNYGVFDSLLADSLVSFFRQSPRRET
jgi:hypothetical protein